MMRTPEDDVAGPAGAEPVVLPVDGILDLHLFRPADVSDVVVEYLRACRDHGILHVRIVHGKGIGNLRRTVHATLARLPFVVSFRTADEDGGGWGATLADLSGKAPDRP